MTTRNLKRLVHGLVLAGALTVVMGSAAYAQRQLIWQNQNTGDVVYWQMQGVDYSYGGNIALDVPLEWKIVGTPDLNRSGSRDLLWQNQNTGDVVFWLM